MTDVRKTILWIKADPLHPVDVGGRIRTYNMMKELSKRHNIIYLALFPEKHDPTAKALANEYSTEQCWIDYSDPKFSKARYGIDLLGNLFFSKLPYVIYKYELTELTDAIIRLTKQYNFDLIISDFLSLSTNLLKASEQYPEINDIRKILFQHNVENMIWRRHYENEKNTLIKAYFKSQWKRMERFEDTTSKFFDGTVTVSPDDSAFFKDEMGINNILGHVNTGVDIGFFTPESRQAQPNSLVFLGAMDWMPNIEGICRFVNESYSRIKQEIPDVTLTIVGRRPVQKVMQLAEQDSSIKVTGTVDDVRPYLQCAQVAIVPLNVGGGTRLKIYEMMASKIPVISTSIGAEGLPVTNGENICIADGAGNFATKTVELLNNTSKSQQLTDSAYKFVDEHFSWAKVVEDFEGMLFQ